MTKGYRLLRYGLGGAAILGLGYGGYQVLSPNSDFDIYNVGAFRFGRAALTIGSIGMDYNRTLYKTDLVQGSEDYENEKKRCHQRSANKMLKLCQDNGGCFIKVGQHIGALDYLLPEEYVQTLKVLHNKAPEMKLEDVYQVLREDLKREPEEVFYDFDPKPLGTASLAQVHKAKLKSNDQEVAVKVQHRYVKNHSFVDIHTMDFLVKAVKRIFPEFEFSWLAEEMKKNLPLELSFTQEGINAEKISTLLENFEWLKVPDIHWGLTTDRVLTMEFCSGGHINDIDYIKRENIDPFSVSTKISQMYAEMIFKWGYVHCDPHPGNVLVSKDEEGHPMIILLDHGLYTQLTHDFRQNYAHFWLSILNADIEGIHTYADKLGVGQQAGLFACMVVARSRSSIEEGIDKTKRTSDESKEIKDNAQKYIRQIADVLALVNRQMILIFKTNDLLRAIEHSLGTSGSMSSLIQMSRACYRCLNNAWYRQCKGTWCRYKIRLANKWQQFKISCYQVYLYCYLSWTGQLLMKMLPEIRKGSSARRRPDLMKSKVKSAVM